MQPPAVVAAAPAEASAVLQLPVFAAPAVVVAVQRLAVVAVAAAAVVEVVAVDAAQAAPAAVVAAAAAVAAAVAPLNIAAASTLRRYFPLATYPPAFFFQLYFFPCSGWLYNAFIFLSASIRQFTEFQEKSKPRKIVGGSGSDKEPVLKCFHTTFLSRIHSVLKTLLTKIGRSDYTLIHQSWYKQLS